MDKATIIELLEELQSYVTYDEIETISPETYRKHEEWKSNKLGQIAEAICRLEEDQQPFGYFHELLDHEGKGQGIWLGCNNRKVVEDSYTEGEVGKEIVTLYKEVVSG